MQVPENLHKIKGFFLCVFEYHLGMINLANIVWLRSFFMIYGNSLQGNAEILVWLFQGQMAEW